MISMKKNMNGMNIMKYLIETVQLLFEYFKDIFLYKYYMNTKDLLKKYNLHITS